MRNRVLFVAVLSTVASLCAGGAALAQPSDTKPPEDSTQVPFNVGMFPYVDVNSHYANPRNHVSIDVIAGAGSEVDGVAIAGAMGFVWERVDGVQLAGASAYAGDLRGVQISGAVSIAAGAVEGVQLAGAVNYAGDVTGAQIGIVNIGGRVKGLQLGIVNVADDVDGASIGLINVVKNGRHGLELVTTNTAAVSAGVKLGTRSFYSTLAMGLQAIEGRAYWLPTAGLGGSIPIAEGGFINIEALASATNEGQEFDRDSVLAQLRLVGGYQLLDWLAIYGGPVLDVYKSSSGKRLADLSYVPALATVERGKTTTDVGLGYVFGAQLL